MWKYLISFLCLPMLNENHHQRGKLRDRALVVTLHWIIIYKHIYICTHTCIYTHVLSYKTSNNEFKGYFAWGSRMRWIGVSQTQYGYILFQHRILITGGSRASVELLWTLVQMSATSQRAIHLHLVIHSLRTMGLQLNLNKSALIFQTELENIWFMGHSKLEPGIV